MHITITFDGLVYYVVRNIGTSGSMLTKPFTTQEGALKEITYLLNEAEKWRGTDTKYLPVGFTDEEGLS